MRKQIEDGLVDMWENGCTPKFMYVGVDAARRLVTEYSGLLRARDDDQVRIIELVTELGAIEVVTSSLVPRDTIYIVAKEAPRHGHLEYMGPNYVRKITNVSPPDPTPNAGLEQGRGDTSSTEEVER